MLQQSSRPGIHSKVRLAVLAALVLTAPINVTSCANIAPPRSFVQPNAILKTDLNGTFYYLQTVTEAPPTNGAMFIGQSSSLLKVKFDIEQNFLFARRAYEQIEGSESAEQLDPAGYLGQPLAAWAISSQFDIIRDYNSTTGEQTNQIIESQERPWNEREFIRVDWSQNQVTDYIGLGLDLFFSDGQPKVEPVSFWQSDPSKPDALHMEHLAQDSGGLKSGDLTYLDITDHMIITPETMTVDNQSYPKCFFYYEQDDCASQAVSVKHAFMKVDPTHAYQPLPWNGLMMNLFGVWDVGLRRLSYNREYGVTNTGASQTAARFNIWSQDSYQNATTLNTDPKTWKARKIPYYAEGSMPFIAASGDPRFPVGYTDSIYPPELYDDFKTIVGQWNSAMLVAVTDATGSAPANDVFVPCHNPVDLSQDDPVCSASLVPDQDADGNVIKDLQGNPIYHARQGDPRNACVFWVDEQQNAGPLGYGPPLYDEVTGETISGQAYIYGAALETYAVRSRDLLLLLNGDITEDDYIAGVPASSWVTANGKAGTGFNSPAMIKQIQRGSQNTAAQVASTGLAGMMAQNRNSSRFTKPLSTTQVEAMSEAMDFTWAKGLSADHGYPPLDTSSAAALSQSIDNRETAIYNGYFSNQAGSRDTVMQVLQGSPLEQMSITPEMMAAGGVSPARTVESLTPAELTEVSPIRQKDLEAQLEWNRQQAEIRGVDFMEFDDNGMDQVLSSYMKKYGVFQGGTLQPFSEQMRIDLIHRIFLAVTLHEMGHNMGCRHNFRASYDAMNYQPSTDTNATDPTTNVHTPGYWELRTGALQNPDPGMDPADGALHPRYVNKPGGAITQYEMNNQIQLTQYSSIMDYGSEFYSDLQGLGLYDKALIKFSYAGYVEVFTDAKPDTTSRTKFAALNTFQSALGFPSPLGPPPAGSTNPFAAIAYQTYPQLFNSGWQGIYERKDVPFTDISPLTVGGGDSLMSDSNGNPLVPYYFCSDDYVGNMTCQRFDAGADAYEQAADLVSRYNNFYLVNNFKRDRENFHTSEAYISRIQNRYFEMLRDQLTWYVLLRSDFQNNLTENAQLQATQSGNGPAGNVTQLENQFFVDENGWGNFTVGVSLGFDLLGQVLSTPNAGEHYLATTDDGTKVWTWAEDTINDPQVATSSLYRSINLIDGKYPDTTWDFNNCGYYWADQCQTRIGYLVDKNIALNVLTESQAYFINRDTSTDVRQYAIGYVIPFKVQLHEKLGALLTNEVSLIAPTFQTQSGSTPTYSVQQYSWLLDDPTVTRTDLIDPDIGFTVSLQAGIDSLAAFPTTFDHDYIDNTQIFVLGNGEASTTDAQIAANGLSDPTPSQLTDSSSGLVAYGGPMEWLIVTDPFNGKQYAAHSLPPTPATVLNTGSGTDPSQNYQIAQVGYREDIGARMLEHLLKLANNVQADASLSDTDSNKIFAQTQYTNYLENIEVMRSLQHAYGYGPFTTDAPFYY